jgi:uncharacterized protein
MHGFMTPCLWPLDARFRGHDNHGMTMKAKHRETTDGFAQRFSEKVAAELKCYVYRLIDPRNGASFYVGRGRGNRVFAHAAEDVGSPETDDDTDLKLGTIRAIRNSGFEVQHVIHRHGMDEQTAVEVESALIDAYPGLTNLIKGSGSDRGVMHANEIMRKYEAQPAIFLHDVVLIDVNRTSDAAYARRSGGPDCWVR